MPQSLSRNILHVVFSTRNREQRLFADIRPRLFAVMATVTERTKSHAYRIGGVDDHVHLAVRLHPTAALSQYLNTLKTESSKWLKQQMGIGADFGWQKGYGAFSIGQSQLPHLVAYIDRQAEHHRRQSFQEEFRRLCSTYEVEIDERYVWD